ncbi:hypothetical protein [Hirschia litorea]|uniref:Uncharacterized protein n=1 Tax=Hirschia litorea TaxID=1199156 RepID=A0ABW2IH26_9PROT
MRNGFWGRMLNAKSFKLTNNTLSEEEIQALQTLGILIELKPLVFANCPHCIQEIPIEYTSDRKPYISCQDGLIELDASTIQRWRIDKQRLFTFLRLELELTEQSNKLEDYIQYLGRMPSSNGGTPIWGLVTNDSYESLLYAKHHLETRSPNDQGLILVDYPLGLATIWPRGHSSLLLDDILNFKNGNLTININLLKQSFPETKKSKGKSGAPQKNDSCPVAVFQKRIQSGKALNTSCKDEAMDIANIETVKFGSNNARSWSSVRNAISKPYKQWKELGFPTDYQISHIT